jgi:hypothetical protein
MALEEWVHLYGGSSSRRTFGFSQMFFSEQELTVEIGRLDMIRVSNH